MATVNELTEAPRDQERAHEAVVSALRAPIAKNMEPVYLAEAFRRTHYEIGGQPTLVRWARAWWRYDGVRYVELDDEALTRDIIRFLHVVVVERKDKDSNTTRKERVTAKGKTVAELARALLKVMPMLGPNMPQWTHRFTDDPMPEQLLACSNGLLDLRTRELVKPTPRLFATTAIGTSWDPKADEPTEWLKFLTSLWGDDKESPRALQQMFGYFLTPDTSQQKLFALVGPPRSGKSTIARILKALLGDDAVVNPTLASIERPFGMAVFVGKMLAVIGDARLGGRADQATVVERLLSVSGEDPISIDRKNRDPINVRLRTRVLLVSNELPRLYDTSGALARRFLILQMTKSFLGEEDTLLERRLLSELPGIFKWAMDGRDDLAENGRFIQPRASEQAVSDLESITSPITVFVRECLTLDFEDLSIERPRTEITKLYERWSEWCKANGREPGNKQVFCRDLRTLLPGLQDLQVRQPDGKRIRVYEGVGLV
jgi:putative DNA primase/helicase